MIKSSKLLRLLIFMLTISGLGLSRADVERNDNAGITYLEFVKEQNSSEERAASCYRLWHIRSLALEMALDDHMTSRNAEKIKKTANSLFQTNVRLYFIESLIRENGLNQISDMAYKLGGEERITFRTGGKEIEMFCIHDINALMQKSANKKTYDASVEASNLYVKTYLKK